MYSQLDKYWEKILYVELVIDPLSNMFIVGSVERLLVLEGNVFGYIERCRLMDSVFEKFMNIN